MSARREATIVRGFRVGLVSSWAVAVLVLTLPVGVHAAPSKHKLMLRGEELSSRVYRAGAAGRTGPPRYAILASGDGGWHGFENVIAESLAAWGYEVHGIDSRQYLHAFTDGDDGVTQEQAAEDFHAMAGSIAGASGGRVTLVGWSAGAALAVLAASRARFHDEYDGVVAISLPTEGILGWRWHDFFEFIPFRRQKGPFFAVPPLLAKLPPLPIVILQSDEDRFISAEDRDEIAAALAGPERNVVIDAGSHSFSHGRERFFRELRAGLRWMSGIGSPAGGRGAKSIPAR